MKTKPVAWIDEQGEVFSNPLSAMRNQAQGNLIPLYTHLVKELTCNSTEIANEKEFWESYAKVSSESNPVKELTDEEILEIAYLRSIFYEHEIIDFAKAILRKAQEK